MAAPQVLVVSRRIERAGRWVAVGRRLAGSACRHAEPGPVGGTFAPLETLAGNGGFRF